MKLYECFTVNSGMIDISKEQVAELSQNLTKSVSVSNAEKVLDWLVKNNSDLTKKEICDFKAILKEIGKDNPQVTSTSSFYGDNVQTVEVI